MAETAKPRVDALDHLVLTVSDIDRTLRFYEDILGMQALSFDAADGTRRTALAFGVQKINLHAAETPFAPHAADPKAGSADLCFLSTTPVQDWAGMLTQAGVAVVCGPIARTGATGPILSIYVRDPDGNLIEIANQT